MSEQAVAPLVLVHHGHQYLITEGYDNHEGISEILDGFAAVFALHLRYRVPFNLHLSGTFLEAVAWHCPDFFDWVKALRREGLVEMIGSGYSQSILTLFSWEHNLRQLNETLDLYHRHLEVDPAEVRGFWVPERVWSTPKLAGLLRSDRLLNGGYDWALIDDRLSYSTDNGAGRVSERRRFDLGSTPAGGAGDGRGPVGDGHLRPYRIEDGRGLVALPISGELRYCIPPRTEGQWDHLRQVLAVTAAAGPGTVAVYGDDLEKTATVGPWTPGPWKREDLAPYQRLLEELAEGRLARPVLASPWLASEPVRTRRRVDPGTFFELACANGAGEDYQGWWNGGPWAFYRKQLMDAEALLKRAAPGAGAPGPASGLWELAWKQLMACSYETAWHDTGAGGVHGPAPWARAIASHVRSVFAIAAAAAWAERPERGPEVGVADMDRDGRDEVVLSNEHLWVMLVPSFGGRLVYLVEAAEGGRMVVGNPADDWNWQEELNWFMEVPRNHPGAFADIGHENDRWELASVRCEPEGVEVELINRQPGSPLAGSVKTFRLESGARHVEVSYRLAGDAGGCVHGSSPGGSSRCDRGPLPQSPADASVGHGLEFALSPDYLSLLRLGRPAVRPVGGSRSHGASAGTAQVWVQLPAGEPVVWDRSPVAECGHGMVLRATAYRLAFALLLGVGAPPDDDTTVAVFADVPAEWTP